jgi:hypothetical protein
MKQVKLYEINRKERINYEYEKIIPKRTKEESEQLTLYLKQYPFSHIVITKDGVVLSDNEEYRVCMELGIEPLFSVVKGLNNKLDEEIYFIKTNLWNGYLTNDAQRFELSLKLFYLMQDKAKQNGDAFDTDIVSFLSRYMKRDTKTTEKILVVAIRMGMFRDTDIINELKTRKSKILKILK